MLLPPRSTLFPYTTLFRSYVIHTGAMFGTIMAFNVWMRIWPRSEEHTSELQSHSDLVCRLLLEKKKRYEYESIATSSIVVLVRIVIDRVLTFNLTRHDSSE